MLLITYSIAIALTVVSDEAFTCVAWDSAGTTTSEVTVPIVLAIGLGVGKAINVQVRALRFAVCGLGFAVCGLRFVLLLTQRRTPSASWPWPPSFPSSGSCCGVCVLLFAVCG